MKLNLGLLMLAGMLGLAACGANKGTRDAGPEAGATSMVEGEACSLEGQKSECAKDGYPLACGACQGHWLLCQGGKWIPIHCDPTPDAAVDTRDAADAASNLDGRRNADIVPSRRTDSATEGTGGTSLAPVEGERCLVEGQQSDCAKDGYPMACGFCSGHWLLCQGGKWIPIHCDPPMPPDAAVDARDAANVDAIVEGG